MASLTERYEERIAGVLSCYDRVVVTGTLPGACYAEGMTRFLYANKIRIFDYPQFAATLLNAQPLSLSFARLCNRTVHKCFLQLT